MRFLGRTKELGLLREFYRVKDASLAVVYGRHRVGKTALVVASLEGSDIPFVYLKCRHTNVTRHVSDLMDFAKETFGLPKREVNDQAFADHARGSLEGALWAIFDGMGKRPGVIVLDDYPALRDGVPGGDAVIRRVLEAHPETGLKVVLCGAKRDVMTGLMTDKSPLHGFVALGLAVEPMDYWETTLFYPTFSDDDKVRLYSVFGGMPFYNSKIDSRLTVKENIIKLVLARDARLRDEVMFLLRLAMTKTVNAERVFEAMAKGATRFSDLYDPSVFSSSPALADSLKRLVGKGFLKKSIPVKAANNKKTVRYQFADNLLHFYYRYVEKNRSRLSVWPAEDVWDRFIKGDFESEYVPKCFEAIEQSVSVKRDRG